MLQGMQRIHDNPRLLADHALGFGIWQGLRSAFLKGGFAVPL